MYVMYNVYLNMPCVFQISDLNPVDSRRIHQSSSEFEYSIWLNEGTEMGQS